MTDQPKPERCCATCFYMSAERPQPAMINPVFMCRYGPLIPMLIPVQGTNPANGQPVTGMQMRAAAPPVAPNDWCHRYKPQESSLPS